MIVIGSVLEHLMRHPDQCAVAYEDHAGETVLTPLRGKDLETNEDRASFRKHFGPIVAIYRARFPYPQNEHGKVRPVRSSAP